MAPDAQPHSLSPLGRSAPLGRPRRRAPALSPRAIPGECAPDQSPPAFFVHLGTWSHFPSQYCRYAFCSQMMPARKFSLPHFSSAPASTWRRPSARPIVGRLPARPAAAPPLPSTGPRLWIFPPQCRWVTGWVKAKAANSARGSSPPWRPLCLTLVAPVSAPASMREAPILPSPWSRAAVPSVRCGLGDFRRASRARATAAFPGVPESAAASTFGRSTNGIGEPSATTAHGNRAAVGFTLPQVDNSDRHQAGRGPGGLSSPPGQRSRSRGDRAPGTVATVCAIRSASALGSLRTAAEPSRARARAVAQSPHSLWGPAFGWPQIRQFIACIRRAKWSWVPLEPGIARSPVSETGTESAGQSGSLPTGKQFSGLSPRPGPR